MFCKSRCGGAKLNFFYTIRCNGNDSGTNTTTAKTTSKESTTTKITTATTTTKHNTGKGLRCYQCQDGMWGSWTKWPKCGDLSGSDIIAESPAESTHTFNCFIQSGTNNGVKWEYRSLNAVESPEKPHCVDNGGWSVNSTLIYGKGCYCDSDL